MKQKLDHFYGNTGSKVDLGAVNNQLTALEARISSLSNIAAKTNIENTFTTNQVVNGFIKSDQGFYKEGSNIRIGTIKQQGEKTVEHMFIQDTAGFRNYCNLKIKHRYSNQNDNQAATLFALSFQNTDMGVFVACEANKIEFVNKTVCKKLVLQELKEMIAASTDFNDFKRRASNW